MVINVSALTLAQPFQITPINNEELECNKTFNITIQSVTGCGVAIGSNNNIEVLIKDDDSK